MSRWLIGMLLLAGLRLGVAHPSDVSQLRVKLTRQQVELRFTFNVLTLSRIVVVDTDHDQRITPQEMAKAAPVVADYLRKKVLISINETETDIGAFRGYECVWPNSATEAITDRDASQRSVDFTFAKPWQGGVQDVWLGFQIFAEVGDQHTIQAIFVQEGQPESPVEFSQQEPEYLYDTGWDAEATLPPTSPSPPQRPWGATIGVLALVGGLCAWLKKRR